MAEIVQVKTPLELQEFLWRNGALIRREDAKFPPPERTDSLDLSQWGVNWAPEPDLYPHLQEFQERAPLVFPFYRAEYPKVL
jgi:hypothetical protein